MEHSLTNLVTETLINEKRIIKINQGPQFQTKGGTILAMFFLFFLIISIVSLIHEDYFISFIFLILSFIPFSLFIDIRGILIDKTLNKIKDYKLFLWFKIGKWSDLDKFKTIYLVQKNVIDSSEYSVNTYHYYQIKLVDEIKGKEIFLAEYKNYYKAQKISIYIANATELELKDFLKGSKRVNIK